MNDILDHGDMVANIVDTYRRASEAQRQAGSSWYPTALGLSAAIAAATGFHTERITFAIAALSPRNPWRWNVFDAYSFAQARAEGRTMPKATTFRRNQLRAWQALDYGQDPWTSAAPKVRAFVAAINGDTESVVVDQWAYRVATTKSVKAIKGSVYDRVAAAYVHAARLVGETPRDLQAITWLVAQTEGLASHRSGRHDLAFKAGTPDWMKEALS